MFGFPNAVLHLLQRAFAIHMLGYRMGLVKCVIRILESVVESLGLVPIQVAVTVMLEAPNDSPSSIAFTFA